jgi:hypothetical protein
MAGSLALASSLTNLFAEVPVTSELSLTKVTAVSFILEVVTALSCILAELTLIFWVPIAIF